MVMVSLVSVMKVRWQVPVPAMVVEPEMPDT